MAYAWQLLSVFKAIKDNIWQTDDVCIDSMNMRMNYQATVSFLLTCSCLVTFNNWFGGDKPIECIGNKGTKVDFLEDFCLIEPKRISVLNENWIEEKLNRKREGDFIYSEHGCQEKEGKLVNKKNEVCDLRHVHDIFYYEWTAMFFVAQAICFYATRFIWKRWENGTMMRMRDSISQKEKEDDQAKIAAEILQERQDKNFNNIYSTGYCFVEFVCILNIICQWIITNSFLGEIEESWITTDYEELNFANLGFHFLAHISHSNETNPWLPLKLMFPRQSHCRLTMYGLGGGTNTQNFLCLLSLNIIHDKVI